MVCVSGQCNLVFDMDSAMVVLVQRSVEGYWS